MAEESVNIATKTVVVREGPMEFEFRIPTLLDEAKIGARIRRLRMLADPLDDPGGTLDPDTLAYLKAMAYFDVLLIAASGAEWAWSKGADGKLVVDSTKFPEDKADVVRLIAARAFWLIYRFRNPFERADSGQDMASEPSV